MFLPLATVALLASALVQAIPAPVDLLDTDVGIRDLELEALLKRDHNPLDLLERSNEERNLEDGVLEARTSKSLNGLATFDTLSANTLINGELGYYGGLYWGGFAAAKRDNTVTGVQPLSSPNVGTYGSFTALLGKPSILTADYTNSNTANFSMSQFYYGCSTSSLLAILSVPTKCNVAAAGYDKSGKLLAYQLFTYSPSLSLKANLQLGTFKAQFKGLDHVRFASTYSTGILGATLIDNLKYAIITKS